MRQHPKFLAFLHLVVGFKFWHERSGQVAHSWFLLTRYARIELLDDALTMESLISLPESGLCDVERADFSEMAVSLGYLVI